MLPADDERKKKARRKNEKDSKNARRHLLPLLLAAADQVGASCSGGGALHRGKIRTAVPYCNSLSSSSYLISGLNRTHLIPNHIL